MQRVITIDIETLPAHEKFLCGDGELVRRAEDAEEYLRTALNGDYGRILCIGFTDEGRADNQLRRGCLGWDKKEAKFTCDERGLLIDFWELMRGFRPGCDRIVGHNVFDFDLKFIYKRSVINGVRPTVELSFARYRSQPIFDTMHEWERWSYRDRISLERLALVLGLDSSKADGVDGSKVYELFLAGAHHQVHDYCLRDVELTRAIFRRMVFAESPSDKLSLSARYVGTARQVGVTA